MYIIESKKRIEVGTIKTCARRCALYRINRHIIEHQLVVVTCPIGKNLTVIQCR